MKSTGSDPYKTNTTSTTPTTMTTTAPVESPTQSPGAYRPPKSSGTFTDMLSMYKGASRSASSPSQSPAPAPAPAPALAPAEASDPQPKMSSPTTIMPATAMQHAGSMDSMTSAAESQATVSDDEDEYDLVRALVRVPPSLLVGILDLDDLLRVPS